MCKHISHFGRTTNRSAAWKPAISFPSLGLTQTWRRSRTKSASRYFAVTLPAGATSTCPCQMSCDFPHKTPGRRASTKEHFYWSSSISVESSRKGSQWCPLRTLERRSLALSGTQQSSDNDPPAVLSGFAVVRLYPRGA